MRLVARVLLVLLCIAAAYIGVVILTAELIFFLLNV
jgi:hypothetical protein